MLPVLVAALFLAAEPMAGALLELKQVYGGGGGGGGGGGDGGGGGSSGRSLLMKMGSSNSSSAIVFEQNHVPFTFTTGSSIALALVIVVRPRQATLISHRCITTCIAQCGGAVR